MNFDVSLGSPLTLPNSQTQGTTVLIPVGASLAYPLTLGSQGLSPIEFILTGIPGVDNYKVVQRP